MPKLFTTRSGKTRRRRTYSAQFEKLESRLLLAGDVAAIVRGGDLILRGDSEDNSVEVRPNEDGGLSVYGVDGTTVNGSADPVAVFEDTVVPDDIRALLGSGDDRVRFESMTVRDDVKVIAGSGADSVGFYAVDVIGTLSTIGGRGSDAFSLDESSVGDLLHVSMSKGQDTIGIDASTVSGHTCLFGGSGSDQIVFRDSTLEKPVLVATGSGQDRVIFDTVDVQDDANFNLGSGDDFLALIDSVFEGVTANGGRGNDDTLCVVGSSFSEAPDHRNFGNVDVDSEESKDDVEAEIEATFLDLVALEARLGTVSEVIFLNSDLSTMSAAVEAAGLTASYQDDTVTVFAPTNDAFDALPDGLLDSPLGDPEGELRDLLDYHTLVGEFDAEVLASMSAVTTVSGDEISIDAMSGLTLNDSAVVTMADIRAKNGVVHTVDAVLSPPTDD